MCKIQVEKADFFSFSKHTSAVAASASYAPGRNVSCEDLE